jgi:hypothetical protein
MTISELALLLKRPMKHVIMKCYCSITVLSLTFFLQSVISVAQIRGTIMDIKTGKPLSGVDVFINKTSTATQSDKDGMFTLENVLTGFQEIILYKNGYALYRSSMKIQDGRAYSLKLSLTPSSKKKATRLTETEKDLLKNQLIGSADGNLVSVLNADEIGTTNESGQQILTAKSPLTIQNNMTGYSLNYYTMDISLQEIYLSPLRYEILPPADLQQTIDWEKKRKEFFQGSQRHWLIALLSDQLKNESYSLVDEKGNNVDAKSIVSVSLLAGYSKLAISQPLTILYKKKDGSVETSRVVTDGPVDINGAGIPINAKTLRVEGDMTKKGMAYQLPIDYEPIAGDVEDVYAQTMERFYEKVYVHTDKPYYYPGEPMWFKGYIHYKEPAWRDSLSRVMYIELINPGKEIALTKTLKIDSGFFNNDFILPDTLKAGNYYLRAYTSLSRNFGDSNLFVKVIPILKSTDKVEPSQENTEALVNNQLTIIADKETYNTRGKITLTLRVKDGEGKPLATNLSLSVTDVFQVVPIAEPVTILNGYPFEKEKQKNLMTLTYPVEYGVGFRGKFLNDKGKPEKTTLTILRMKPRDVMMTETDEQGVFSVSGLNFYDSATFSIKSDKAKDQPYGKIELLSREVPAANFQTTSINLAVQGTQSQQRIISEYEVPKDVRMLESVEVRARRIEDPVDRVERSYGKADVVLGEKDLTDKGYPNLAYYLVGKVAGLIVRPESETVVFSRANTQSINFGKEPLVTIDDVPMGGSAYATIASINPANVKSIEVTRRMNVLYGSQGANGVISIYTKQGLLAEDLSVTPNFQKMEISGYSSFREFKEPDYDNPNTDKTKADYRSTLYWNPNITTDSTTGIATISFFAGDLPGRYRVTAEGVTQSGEPVRCIYFVEVTAN